MARCIFTAFLLLVGLIPALVLPVAVSWAQQSPTIEMKDGVVSIKRVALVIGNSAYDSVPLANPVNDAKLMAKTLRDKGFEVIEAINVDWRGMKKAMRNFGRKLKKYGESTVGLFYFAGHGIQSNGSNYLIPVGASIEDEGDLEIEAVESRWMLEKMRYAKNETNIIILDACRNNPYSSASGGSGVGLTRKMEGAPDGSLIAFATSPGAVAADGKGNNSPYVLALVEQMAVPGQGLLDVFANAAKTVAEQTDRQQIPWSENSLLTNDSFHFTELASAGNKVAASDAGMSVMATDKEVIFWQAVQNSGNPADFQAYMDKYPDGDFAVLAKNHLAALRQKLQGAERALELSRAELHTLQEMLAVLGYDFGGRG